jgi:hypothetical protein
VIELASRTTLLKTVEYHIKISKTVHFLDFQKKSNNNFGHLSQDKMRQKTNRDKMIENV